MKAFLVPNSHIHQFGKNAKAFWDQEFFNLGALTAVILLRCKNRVFAALFFNLIGIIGAYEKKMKVGLRKKSPK